VAEQAQVLTSWPPAGLRAVPDVEPTSHDVQAAAEGVVLDEGFRVEFFGEHFRLSDRVGLMPMMEFALAGQKGLDSEDMAGLAAMYKLIRSVIHRPPLLDENGEKVRDENGRALRDETEWTRFSELAEDESADGEEIMAFVNRAMEVLSARPPKRREVSSASSPQTSATSRPASSSRATHPEVDGLVSIADLAR